MIKMFGTTHIALVYGDITTQRVDAIVNAANSSLMGGGGVDGAIHKAGGPGIKAECEKIVRAHGRLPEGEAVVTAAGRLPARWVIHTVGPRWNGGGADKAQVLANAYRSSLMVAREHNARTVAFPSIATGAYGYPVGQAAAVALATVKSELEAHPGSLDEVRFVLFEQHTLDVYEAALQTLLSEVEQ